MSQEVTECLGIPVVNNQTDKNLTLKIDDGAVVCTTAQWANTRTEFQSNALLKVCVCVGGRGPKKPKKCRIVVFEKTQL